MCRIYCQSDRQTDDQNDGETNRLTAIQIIRQIDEKTIETNKKYRQTDTERHAEVEKTCPLLLGLFAAAKSLDLAFLRTSEEVSQAEFPSISRRRQAAFPEVGQARVMSCYVRKQLSLGQCRLVSSHVTLRPKAGFHGMGLAHVMLCHVMSKNGIPQGMQARVMLCHVMSKQSQKRYMVSGSLCPLISSFDVSYLVSFVVRGQRPRRGQ